MCALDILQATRVCPSCSNRLGSYTDCIFRPKGRTYAELDVLFQAKVSARSFRTTDVVALDGSRSDYESGNEKKSMDKGAVQYGVDEKLERL